MKNLVGVFETIFDLGYIFIIWFFVSKMIKNSKFAFSKNKKISLYVLIAFSFLAFGDTFHVGARAFAYMFGGIEKNVSLIGFGKLLSSYTITFFYILFGEIWRERFSKKITPIYIAMQCLLCVRMVVMFFPQNGWFVSPSPFLWSMLRNIPLVVFGVWFAINLKNEAKKQKDIVFEKTGNYIAFSYLCYALVIFIAPFIAPFGMFMIPKTIAYVLVCNEMYKLYFKK